MSNRIFCHTNVESVDTRYGRAIARLAVRERVDVNERASCCTISAYTATGDNKMEYLVLCGMSLTNVKDSDLVDVVLLAMLSLAKHYIPGTLVLAMDRGLILDAPHGVETKLFEAAPMIHPTGVPGTMVVSDKALAAHQVQAKDWLIGYDNYVPEGVNPRTMVVGQY